ncbi:hypothetical protein Dimus_004143 [Dionaea muscipula]
MELQGQEGSKIKLREGGKAVFGRGNGFRSEDHLTVSRRHISFQLITPSHQESGSQTTPKVSFEVIGRNPVWVNRREDGEVRVFKRFERTELGIGDMLCVDGKNPVWFTVKKAGEAVEEREAREGVEARGVDSREWLPIDSKLNGNEDLGLQFIDVSDIDPVKEFGFLVIGHEFDSYPKCTVGDMNWFLDVPGEDEEDEDDSENERKRRPKRKTKKAKGNRDDTDDVYWTDESGDEKELIGNARKLQRPKYHTRSKDRVGPDKLIGNIKESDRKKSDPFSQEEDETLGGFIIHNDEVEEEEQTGQDEEEDEEEEFDEEEDDDD